MTPEGKLKREAKSILDPLKPHLWYYFAQDRYTSGIMDVIGCYHGFFFSFELKAPDESPRELQRHNINKVLKAGGFSSEVTNSTELKIYLQLIKDQHEQLENYRRRYSRE